METVLEKANESTTIRRNIMNINDRTMKVGDKVLCVRQDFPVVKEYGGILEEAKDTPKLGESLIIDEILGDYLRFDKYDTPESNNWWKSDRFVPNNIECLSMEQLKEAYNWNLNRTQ